MPSEIAETKEQCSSDARCSFGIFNARAKCGCGAEVMELGAWNF